MQDNIEQIMNILSVGNGKRDATACAPTNIARVTSAEVRADDGRVLARLRVALWGLLTFHQNSIVHFSQ